MTIRGVFYCIFLYCFLSFLSLAQLFPQDRIVVRSDTSWFTSDRDYNLILAAEKGDSAVVAMLIEKNADANAETWEGVTPLIYASQNGFLAIVKMLVEAGADINHQADDGGTALISAVKFNHGHVVDFLLMHGADPDIRDGFGVTALMYAAAYNHYEMADILLYYDANTTLKDFYGNTALHVAAYTGSLETAELIAELIDSIDVRNNQGFTPLMIAASIGDSAMCALLLRKGADPNMLNHQGHDALSIALLNGHYSLAPMFVNFGSNINQWFSVSRKTIDLIPRHSPTWEYLYSSGARPAFLPSFGSTSVGLATVFNLDDFMMGFFLGIKDRRYGVELQTKLFMRSWNIPILSETPDNILYQFKERRYIWTGSLSRNFYFIRKSSEAAGLCFSAGFGYTWGRYAGASRRPVNKYFFNPAGGIAIKKGAWEIKCLYAHTPLNVISIAPGRIELSVSYSFFLPSEKTRKIIIPWLHE